MGKKTARRKRNCELMRLGTRRIIGKDVGEAGSFLLRENGDVRFLHPSEIVNFTDPWYDDIRPDHIALDTWVHVLSKA